MNKYVALLRGINVGGKNKVKMDKLKSLFEQMEFQNIGTYIQSGNVIFETEVEDANAICTVIESKLKEELGFGVPVIVRSIEDLEEISKQNIYVSRDNWENSVYITFLSGNPTNQFVNGINFKDNDDEIHVMEREIILFCPDGYRNTKYSNNFFERKLGVSATTRNWKTINKVISIGREI